MLTYLGITCDDEKHKLVVVENIGVPSPLDFLPGNFEEVLPVHYHRIIEKDWIST